MKSVVLVPGFWHGTWCWNPTSIHLANRGIPSVAVDLEGQGLDGTPPRSFWRRPFSEPEFSSETTPIGSVTATTAANDLLSKIRLIGRGEPCVVVAHSMGGAVATLAAEREPSLFAHLVYVAAFTPVDGSPAGAYVMDPKNDGERGTGLLAADPNAVGASRIDTGNLDGHDSVRAALHGDLPADRADAVIKLLDVDAPVGIAAEPIAATRERFGSIPRTYLVCENDYMIRPAVQYELIQKMDELSELTTSVVSIESSHSPFLSQPDVVAGVIASAWG